MDHKDLPLQLLLSCHIAQSVDLRGAMASPVADSDLYFGKFDHPWKGFSVSGGVKLKENNNHHQQPTPPHPPAASTYMHIQDKIK